MKNKIILILLFLCFSPLLSKIDNYEDLIEGSYFRTSGIYNVAPDRGLEQHFKLNYDIICLSQSDGSGIQVRFIPFGTLVTSCSDDYYFHLFGIFKMHFNKN